MDSDSDDSDESIEECRDPDRSRDDDIMQKEDFNLQHNAQEAPLQDATSRPLDASRRNVSDRLIDEGFCESMSEGQSRHLGLRNGKSRVWSDVGGAEWERVELWGCERKQIGRTDERWSSRRNSHTVAFRRMSN